MSTVAKYLTVIAIACSLFVSCERNQNSGFALLEEGKGIPGICQIGQRPSSARKSVATKTVRTTFHERGVGAVKEYSSGALIFDTIDRGDGERIARVSLLCNSSALKQEHKPNAERRVQTKLGLELMPSTPTLQSVIAAYGQPARKYESNQEASLLEDIRNGTSYLIRSGGGDTPEYLHYPAVGIAFVIVQGTVVKCSVEEPRTRQIWRY